jgi:hypothetical protein
MKYDGRTEMQIRDSMKLAIAASLQEVLQQPLHVKVLSSEIGHEDLQPEGKLFSLKFRVTVLPRKIEPKEEDAQK